MNYPEEIEKTPLYKMWNKYDKIEKKLPKKIRAYKHFTTYLFPVIMGTVKKCLVRGVNDKTISSHEDLIAQLLKYPGDTAVQAARFYTAQCFYAWNQHIMQPILHLNRIQLAINEEVKTVKKLKATDSEFKANHQDEDDTLLAINRIKSRKWFKDAVDKVYSALIKDDELRVNLLTLMVDKIVNDYNERTGGYLLINEDKLYEYNRWQKRHGKSTLNLNKFNYKIDTERIGLTNDDIEQFSSSISAVSTPDITPQTSPQAKPKPKPKSTTNINNNNNISSRTRKNNNKDKEEKEIKPDKDMNDDLDKSEFPSDSEDDEE